MTWLLWRPHRTDLLIIILSFLTLICFGLYYFFTGLTELKNFHLETAQNKFEKIYFIPSSLSLITFKQIPDIEIWRLGTEIAELSSELLLLENEQLLGEKDYSQKINNSNNNINLKVAELSKQSNKPYSFLGKITKIKDKLNQMRAATNLIEFFLTGEKQITFLLQNSDELRASGGFMGSFAVMKLSGGKIISLELYDIYDAAGQLKNNPPAPTGIKEYLSEDGSWSLADKNWHPDFTINAQKISNDLKAAGFGENNLIIAVNNKLIEKIFNLTGEIYLSDYGITINADNLTLLAGSHREDYFPGSKNKKFFLQTLTNNLKNKFVNLSHEKQAQLILLLLAELNSKNLQLAANSYDLQKQLEVLKLNSNLESKPKNIPLVYALESNVGVNKINKYIDREVNLNTQNNLINYELVLKNNAPENFEGDYINYQRFIYNPDFELISLELDNQKIKNFDKNIINNFSGDEFIQIGFLAPLKKNSQTKIIIRLKPKNKLAQLYLPKQPGTLPYPLTVISPLEAKYTQDQDLLISL